MRGRSGVRWVPAWTAVMLFAGYALHHPSVPESWSLLPLVAAGPLAALVLTIVSLAVDHAAAAPHRLLAALSGGVWIAAVGHWGFSQWRTVALCAGVVVVSCLEYLLPAPAPIPHTGVVEEVDRRPAQVQSWEALLNRLVRGQQKGKAAARDPLRVVSVTPWPSRDGEQVRVQLPEDMTAKDLSAYCDRIAGARHLLHGCIVRVLDGAHQGEAVLDVMLRDCLADARTINEPTTAASINDDFDIATAPRGEHLKVCLRQKSALVGGTIGSGKTTLLHRIIMFLARCVDALIWVIDLNGGGVAGPWVGPWARGEAKAPVVDWVADYEAEAAVMIAVAKAVAKDRKTSKEATGRKRAANTTILPVDHKLPAIVIITDEGGEIRQAAGLLGALVDQGIARVAQIARAEGVRVVMSVLRGTSDLLEKGLRTVVGIRVCLRMDEEGEYDHVLGVNPGRTRLLHVGSAYVYRTDTDHRPVLARTVDVDLHSIERHAVATAPLRPQMDGRARQVAARVTVRDVLDGLDPKDYPEIARTAVMKDVAAGRAYEGRWERKAVMLAELRGEEVPEDDGPGDEPTPDRPTVAEPGSAVEHLLLATGVTVGSDGATEARKPVVPADVDAEFAVLASAEHLNRVGVPLAEQSAAPAPTTREAILLVLRDAKPDRLTCAQVHARLAETGVQVSMPRVHELLGKLVGRGEAAREGTGYTVV